MCVILHPRGIQEPYQLLSLWQMLEKNSLKAGVNRYASTHICNPNAPATEGGGSQVPEVHEFQACLGNMRPHLKNKTYFVHGFKYFSTDQLTIAIDLVRQKGMVCSPRCLQEAETDR